jgi:hypothetical protein
MMSVCGMPRRKKQPLCVRGMRTSVVAFLTIVIEATTTLAKRMIPSVQQKPNRPYSLTNNEEGDDGERSDFEHAYDYSSERMNDSDNEDIVDLVSSDPPSAVRASTLHRPTQKQCAYHSQAPAINDTNYKQTCASCQRYKQINKDCSLRMCKRCCIESPSYCKAHKYSKTTGTPKPYEHNSLAIAQKSSSPLGQQQQLDHQVLPGVLEKVESAIRDRRSVYISYSAGTSGNQARRIDPQALKQGKEGLLVESHCHLANASRSFYLYKIRRIEDHEWTTPNT